MTPKRILLGLALAALVFPLAASAAVTFDLPEDIVTEAQSAEGAVVTYTATATNNGNPVPVTCSPESGSTFPIATTVVDCTAGGANDSFRVTVEDTTPPAISNLARRVVEATSSEGTTVTWLTPQATDTVDGPVPVACTPASGSIFQLGMTPVTCTAADDSGNQSTGIFTVLVRDTTPPAFGTYANIDIPATSPAGATVLYPTPAVTDNADPAPVVSCIPPPGTFNIGIATVRCTAEDEAGNVSNVFMFTVTVRSASGPPPPPGDTAPPVFTPASPPDLVREANGPAGSVVSYTPPQAVDGVEGPLPATCTPPPGSRFAIGTTEVVCRASDSSGNQGAVAFDVRVEDTTAPTIVAPAPITVGAGEVPVVSAADPAVAAFLAGASASDLVTANPTVTTDAPGAFGLGTTQVTFTARDEAGNSASASSSVTVVSGTAPPPVTRDTVPPGDVKNLSARAGSRVVTLTWTPPTDADFDHVEVFRSPAGASGSQPASRLYSGTARTFRDGGVRNGVEYRYLVVSVDEAANASSGVAVVARPQASLLLRPQDGARVTRPPALAWARFARATYYNVQMYRGTRKVLTAWPVRPRLALRSSWRFQRRRERLTPGVYRWFVWPGLGAKSRARYGPLLGESTFVVARG